MLLDRLLLAFGAHSLCHFWFCGGFWTLRSIFALSVSFASASIKAALKEGVWARGLETQVGACTESENREGYPLDMVPAACTHKGRNILSSTLSNALAGFGRQR